MEHATQHLGPTVVHAAGYLWLIPLFPAVGALINATMGIRIQRNLGKKFNHAIAIGMMTLSFLVALRAFAQMYALPGNERFLQNTVWTMLQAGHMRFDLAFALDPLSMMMVLIITFIGTLIHVFSTGYMADEPSYWRFFAYLNLFVFAMLLLVMGDNFAMMFFGWEGVGLASYLLISFWYTDIEKAKAGMKAFVVNRFGDFGFIIGLFLLFWSLGGSWQPRADARSVSYAPEIGYKANPAAGNPFESTGPRTAVVDGHAIPLGPTLNFRELRDQVVIEGTGVAEHLRHQTLWGVALLTLVGIFMFVGAMGKSAQLPLYVWLPDAMAGPTPVSALIHAATMVTAGVYMVARLSYLYAMSPTAMGWVATIGVLTAFFAATIGFFQYDIKKVLAYSTVSQLGYMFLACGVGAFGAGMFHVFTHAFFKACLFLGSGSVIMAMHHEQDMRPMGGLAAKVPQTFRTMMVATIAIAGIPPLAGFFSKDQILGSAFAAGHPVLFAVGLGTAGLTAFYMFRLARMTFYGGFRGPKELEGRIHESPAPMTVTLWVLAAGSVLVGFLGVPPVLGGGNTFLRFLEPSLAKVPEHHLSHATEYVLMALSVGVAIAGIALAWRWYGAKDATVDVPSAAANAFYEKTGALGPVVANKWNVDEGIEAILLSPFRKVGTFLWRGIDALFIDGIANASAFLVELTGDLMRFFTTGNVRNYALGLSLGVLVFAAFVLLR